MTESTVRKQEAHSPGGWRCIVGEREGLQPHMEAVWFEIFSEGAYIHHIKHTPVRPPCPWWKRGWCQEAQALWITHLLGVFLVSHPNGLFYPPKINWYKGRETKGSFCLLFLCLVPWNDRGAFPKQGRLTAIAKVTRHMLNHGRVDQAKPCTQRAHVKTANHVGWRWAHLLEIAQRSLPYRLLLIMLRQRRI